MAAYMAAVELAWTLANCIDEHLRVAERHRVYVALGSGDTDIAIVGLISVAARERVMLPRRVIDAARLWHAAYDDLDARLGTLVTSIPVAPEPRPATPHKKITRLSTTKAYRRADSHRSADGSA
jgi:hypothetical protein